MLDIKKLNKPFGPWPQTRSNTLHHLPTLQASGVLQAPAIHRKKASTQRLIMMLRKKSNSES